MAFVFLIFHLRTPAHSSDICDCLYGSVNCPYVRCLKSSPGAGIYDIIASFGMQIFAVGFLHIFSCALTGLIAARRDF